MLLTIWIFLHQMENPGQCGTSYTGLIALCFIRGELLAIVGLKILNQHFLDDPQSIKVTTLSNTILIVFIIHTWFGKHVHHVIDTVVRICIVTLSLQMEQKLGLLKIAAVKTNNDNDNKN